MQRDRDSSESDDRIRAQHMLEAALDASRFVDGRTRTDLDSDAMLLRALTNAIQEIGEAANHLSDQSRSRIPGVPWPEVVKMRNVLVHVYWGIDRDRLWKTAVEDLPILTKALERAFETWKLP